MKDLLNYLRNSKINKLNQITGFELTQYLSIPGIKKIQQIVK